MPMTDEQLNNYEQLLRQQSDNAAQQRIGNLGNQYSNYGSPSMTNTVNSFNYDRLNDYMNALGKREELAQTWQQTANQRALTSAQIKNMQNEHSRGLMGLALQRQQQKQQHEQHTQQMEHARALQKGQLEHATRLQAAGFAQDTLQETRRQKAAIDLQKQNIAAQQAMEKSRQELEHKHFNTQQQLANLQLQEQSTARVGTERFRERSHIENLKEQKQQRLAQEAQHAATLAEARRAAGIAEAFRQRSHDENLAEQINARTTQQALQRDLQTQQLNQQHNQFQQNLADRNVDRSFQAHQARAGREHATLLNRENIEARDRELYARRQDVLANLRHQSDVLGEQRRANMTSEQIQRDLHDRNIAEQRTARQQNLAWQREQHIDDLDDRRTARTQEIQARERAQRSQQAHAVGERREESAARAALQRENIAAQQAEATRRLGFESGVHRDTIRERQADRAMTQQQFNEQMRMAKNREIEAKRMNIESMKLARGRTTHSEWLDKFNASLAHMGLQLKREKLEQLVNGTIQPPDENSTNQQKLSWLSSILSESEGFSNAQQERAYRSGRDINDLRMQELQVAAQLRAAGAGAAGNIFNNILAPTVTGAYDLVFGN